MKMLLFAVVALALLPRAHASCTITLSPATSTLQTTQTEGITATLSGSSCGSTTSWNLSCSPSGSSCGSLTNKTRTTATYHAPTTPPSGTVTATVKAASNGFTCSGSCAVVTIKVPTNLTITPANALIYLQNSETMSATENYSDGSSAPASGATFTSSNTSVASVSGSTVTGASFSAIPGSPTITGNFTDPFTNTNVTGNTLVSVIPAVQINATFPPGSTSTDFADFQNDVIANQYVWGVNVNLVWDKIEKSNSQGTGSGGYDFTTFDASLAAFFNTNGSLANAPTKKLNLVVVGVNDTSTQNPANVSTPAYVFTPTWNTSAKNNPPSWLNWTPPEPTGNSSNGLAGGLDVVTCQSYQGNGSTDTGFPVVYEDPYVVAYGNFIQAVLKHYSHACDSTTPPCSPTGGNAAPYNGPTLASYVGYIRIGLSSGGEVFPHCSSSLPGFSETAWVSTYIGGIEGAERTFQTNDSSTVQLAAALNWQPGGTDGTFPDPEASQADNSGAQSQAFGSQGLQLSDDYNYSNYQTCSSTHTQNCPCQSDWCTNFNNYYNLSPYNQLPVTAPLELQTYFYSDPNCEGQISGCTDSGAQARAVTTGSLYDLVPFAVQRHSNDLELYTYDLLYAYDSNYCALKGADQHYCPLNSTFVSHYKTVIQNAATGQ